MTSSVQVFHALYIGDIGAWAVTAKREPLSLSHSLSSVWPIRYVFLLRPTHLS